MRAKALDIEDKYKKDAEEAKTKKEEHKRRHRDGMRDEAAELAVVMHA